MNRIRKWIEARLWWRAWPIARCAWCKRRFVRSWPWNALEEDCSRECAGAHMDFVDAGGIVFVDEAPNMTAEQWADLQRPRASLQWSAVQTAKVAHRFWEGFE